MRIILTRRARLDLGALQKTSVQKWGERVTREYLDAIGEAFLLLQEYPKLLIRKEYSKHFSFYSVREHLLVCAIIEDIIYVLMVKYGGMDMTVMLSELEPTLMQEAQIMHAKLKKAQKAL